VDVKHPFARCPECPLVDQPFVPGNGPTQTDLVIVGQAPGDQEVDQRKPFVGPAGKALRRALDLLGVDHLSKVFFTNTVLCHPGKTRTGRDKKPPRAAIVACRERLRREIEETGPGWILAVGAVAGARVTGKGVVISRSRCSLLGHPLSSDGIGGYDALVGITHHPSAPFPRLLLEADIRALLSFPNGGRTPDVYREDGGVSTDR
jgi:uracil-DNA glycosylase family 4